MAFDAEEFLRDFRVESRTEGHKHCRPGWVNMPCPFCSGNRGYHLGYSLQGDFFRCWRCGFHSITEVIREFAGVGWDRAKALREEYWTGGRSLDPLIKKKAGAAQLKFPAGTDALGVPHLRYLQRRGFSCTSLQDTWGLLGTGPVAFAESDESRYDYSYRIIAPIRYNDRLVSYQARDYTDRQLEKYKACPIELEVIHHKEILYGLDLARTRRAILVEGITDVWRLGPGAIAGFGVEMKPSQVSLIADRFSRVYIMFDDDAAGLRSASKISSNLSMVGVSCEICLIKGDPGELPQSEADLYVRQLLGRNR